MICTADWASWPIKGIGIVQCTLDIKLSSVLHVPAFPVNMLYFCALIDQVDCRITVDREMCLIGDRLTGRRMGTRIRRRGLDREGLGQMGSRVFAAIVEEREFVANITAEWGMYPLLNVQVVSCCNECSR